ncbi:hypothetical protein G6F66_015526 [Rhizopus arrhizus]|nr:hypothetical protein G6F66_015526 [Rhizopus arrhizus]
MKTFTLQRGWRMPSSTTLELILNGTVNASFCRFSRLAPTQVSMVTTSTGISAWRRRAISLPMRSTLPGR